MKVSILKSLGLLFIILLWNTIAYPQKLPDDSSYVNNKRLTGVAISGGALFAGTMTGLYYLWYKDYPQSHFHFINDNGEWMQIDKLGHMMTSYYVGRLGYETLRWCGVNEKHATIYGGSSGFIYLLTIEILDGFSAKWGASYGDLIANTAGALLFIGQQLTWKDQKLMMKFSYHPTNYAQYNPGQMGSNGIQRLLKDYNGHTYWLSANPKSFMKNTACFPGWINISFGYGAEGMTGPYNNIEGEHIPDFERYRKFFLTLDVDLTRIKTRSVFLKALFNLVGFVKIPFPTIEYNTKGQFKFHYLYF